MSQAESFEHNKIKTIIYEKLKEWFGAAQNEYPISGHEADVYAITPESTTIYVEIIWSSSLQNFFRDLSMIQSCDANVKIVIVNPKILENAKFLREFEKVAISQRRYGISMLGKMIDGQKILDNHDYINGELKNLFIEVVLYSQKFKAPSIEKIKLPEVRPAYKIEEQLVSNLFKVYKYPQKIYSCSTSFRTPREISEEIGESIRGHSYILKNKQLYTFDNLSEASSIYKKIMDNDVVQECDILTMIKNNDTRNYVIELLNNCLKGFCFKKGLHYDKKFKRYMCKLKDGKDNIFRWKPREKYSERAIAQCYYNDDGQLSYCRHNAANLSFCMIDDNFYLKIAHTTVFTTDGILPVDALKRRSLMRSYIAKEFNPAYLDNLLFWAKYLAWPENCIMITSGNDSIEINIIPTEVTCPYGIAHEELSRAALQEFGLYRG